jgi:hypothetical protein
MPAFEILTEMYLFVLYFSAAVPFLSRVLTIGPRYLYIRFMF